MLRVPENWGVRVRVRGRGTDHALQIGACVCVCVCLLKNMYFGGKYINGFCGYCGRDERGKKVLANSLLIKLLSDRSEASSVKLFKPVINAQGCKLAYLTLQATLALI